MSSGKTAQLNTEGFSGTKIALINDGKVLVCLRDDKPGIDFPGMWDLPGGGREAGETPFQTAAREIKEELGLSLQPEDVVWEKTFLAVTDASKTAVFMVVNLTSEQIKAVKFGDEGQAWKMMPVDEFLSHQNAVAGMQTRLRDYLTSMRA